VKRLIVCALLAAPAIGQSVPLTPYVGGRVVTHVTKDTGWHLFTSPHDEVSYTYEWPGVYFEAQFTGGAVDVKVNDDQDNLYLYIDGVHKLTLTRPGRVTVALKDLGAGTHDVRLEKSSETQSSTGTFDGFTVDSVAETLPPPHYDRNIEFIGDSYTVGYGNTSRGQTCTVDDVRDTTDTSLSFAPAAAKHFNAGYRILADSGHGVVRNYGGMEPGNTMPVLYNYTLLDKSVAAPDDGWAPDVVVIGLGTNDFSTPLGPGEQWQTRDALRADFVHTYVAFVKSLRAKWPAAHIILMSSTNFGGEIIGAVDAVAAQLKDGGETNLEVIAFSGLDWQACDAHPSLKDERILSQLLIDRIFLLPRFAVAGASR
jgi:lysophospholipase L1-like esterase